MMKDKKKDSLTLKFKVNFSVILHLVLQLIEEDIRHEETKCPERNVRLNQNQAE